MAKQNPQTKLGDYVEGNPNMKSMETPRLSLHDAHPAAIVIPKIDFQVLGSPDPPST